MHIRLRPKVWDEVIGQDHIVRGLENIELSGRAILLEGEKGTGKTTIGLILADLFADSKENIKHVNCGHTSTVAEMREYVNGFSKSSIFGKRKCYVFDEPQLLSHKAVNELLIPFENLPKNVLVIMCSALSEKIEPMLLDRMIRFRTKMLDDKTSLKFLNSICKKEEIKLSKYVKTLIVEKCEGVPRKILTALPKIIGADDSDVEYLLELNILDEDEDVLILFKLLLAKKSWDEVKGYLNTLLKNKQPEAIRMGLLSLIGYNLSSNFSRGPGHQRFLCDSFDMLSNFVIPEKANLIVNINKITRL